MGAFGGGSVLRGDLLGIVDGVGGAMRAAGVDALEGEVLCEVVVVLPGRVQRDALLLLA
jgi:hypothetical protein